MISARRSDEAGELGRQVVRWPLCLAGHGMLKVRVPTNCLHIHDFTVVNHLHGAGASDHACGEAGCDIVEVKTARGRGSGKRQRQVTRRSIEPALHEMITVRTMADALAEWVRQPGFSGQGQLIFPNAPYASFAAGTSSYKAPSN